MTIWLLATGIGHSTYNQLKERKVLAQGWPKIGDLSALLPIKNDPVKESKFKEIIKMLVTYVYDTPDDQALERKPGKIMLNLLKIKKGDYVICCDGKSVQGVAKITENCSYKYDDSGEYDYSQTISPVTEWRDITKPHGIKLKSMGPVGIQEYGGEQSEIISMFDGKA